MPPRAPMGLEEIRIGIYVSHFAGERFSFWFTFHNLALLPAKGEKLVQLATRSFQMKPEMQIPSP